MPVETRLLVLQVSYKQEIALPRGVTVAQMILDHFVIVRIYARQPIDNQSVMAV